MSLEFLHPPGWPRAKGYAHGVAASGRMVFVSGCVGWDHNEQFVHQDMVGQIKLALQNVVAVLHEAGAKPSDIARMTWYVTDKETYIAGRTEIGAIYREIIGHHFPAMTVVQVVALVEEQAKVEIEVTAVIS